MKLTPKQEKFCQSIAYKEFDFIWEAYAAHYDVKKSSRNSLYQNSCKLLASTKITSRIKDIEAEIVTKSQSTLDEILVAMSKRVRMDMRTYHKKDGTLLQPHEMNEDQAMCISEWDTRTTYIGKGDDVQRVETTKYKLVDLKSLWDMFLKRYGAYITNVNVKTDNLDHLQDIIDQIKD